MKWNLSSSCKEPLTCISNPLIFYFKRGLSITKTTSLVRLKTVNTVSGGCAVRRSGEFRSDFCGFKPRVLTILLCQLYLYKMVNTLLQRISDQTSQIFPWLMTFLPIFNSKWIQQNKRRTFLLCFSCWKKSRSEAKTIIKTFFIFFFLHWIK